MGKIVSDVGSNLDSVVSGIAGLVTNVTQAVTQLNGVAQGFVTPQADRYVVSMSVPNDINGALKSAMTAALAKATAVFTKQWPDLTAAGADNGCVQAYVTGSSSVACVVDRLTSDFNTWEISADPTTIQQMANTIALNIQGQMGLAGSASGHHALNMNQSINWAVAYGLFQIDVNNQGLIYAYTAALDSGFARATSLRQKR